MTNRRFTGLTDPGMLRSVNQDNFYTDPDGRFFIVADGMGGHAGGQEASLIATQTVKEYLEKSWDSEASSYEILEEAIIKANEGILEDQQNHPERGEMGTTVVVVLFRGEQPLKAHVGDSRLYRLRQGKLEQITNDHTWVARALKMGDIEPEDAKTHPWRHVLFQCLGRKDTHTPEIAKLDIQSGDRLLLCSDGLTEEVADAEIQEIFQRSESCEAIAENLIEAAKEAGGSDNITVVIVAQE
ncbi:MAG: Stp1/IreP family PP2C-type Ser/Thr phosphatase [Crocosphaera sp.]